MSVRESNNSAFFIPNLRIQSLSIKSPEGILREEGFAGWTMSLDLIVSLFLWTE